jgi:hypothetical protein
MADAAQANCIELFIEGQAFLLSYDMAPPPPPPLSPVSKLNQRHTGRLGNRGNLLIGEGVGGLLLIIQCSLSSNIV